MANEPRKPRFTNEKWLKICFIVSDVGMYVLLGIGAFFWRPAIWLFIAAWVLAQIFAWHLQKLEAWQDAQWTNEKSTITSVIMDVSRLRRLLESTDETLQRPSSIHVRLENGRELPLSWNNFLRAYPSENVGYEVRQIDGETRFQNVETG